MRLHTLHVTETGTLKNSSNGIRKIIYIIYKFTQSMYETSTYILAGLPSKWI
jgi:hypothetical protein